MPLDLICCPTESFLPILITFLSFLDLLAFFLEFPETDIQLIPLVYQLAHLGHEDNVCQVETAVLVVIVEVGVRIGEGIHNFWVYY